MIKCPNCGNKNIEIVEHLIYHRHTKIKDGKLSIGKLTTGGEYAISGIRFFCHPCKNDPTMGSKKTEWTASKEEKIEAIKLIEELTDETGEL